MSLFESLTSMVFVLLSLQNAFTRRLQTMSRDVLWPAAARVYDIYVYIWQGLLLFFVEMSRLNLCNDSRESRGYTCGTPALVLEPRRSRRGNYGDSDPLSGSCSAFLLACFVVPARWRGCLLERCFERERTESPANHTPFKVRGTSQCTLQTASIVLMPPAQGLRTSIPCLKGGFLFASTIVKQYQTGTGKQDSVWPVVWWRWKDVFPLPWSGA